MPTTPELRALLFGTPFGEVWPPKPNPPPLSIDGRTAALRILRKYVTNLTFYRTMAKGQLPQPFSIPEKRFHIEWPDQEQVTVEPTIAIIPAPEANYDVIGLVSYVEEDTRDVYAQGTMLQWMSEYRESIQLEVWTRYKSERRAILSGIETAMSPTEQMSGLRFRMPEYFNELVCFTLMKRRLIDDGESAKYRRKAQLEIEMRFNIVALVNYSPFNSVVKADLDVDEDTELPVTVEVTK